jgi:hypothetical protein
MTVKLPRRWFSFSLRSLLLVMTVLCIWLGWESSVVRQRRRMLSKLQVSPAFQITTAKSWAAIFAGGPPPPQPVATIPTVRRWLGDEAIQEIGYFRHMQGFTDGDVDRLVKLFPEAKVQETINYEPCHPGCFPRGTLVETPHGRCRIETIQPGDAIIAFLASGEMVTAHVQSVFVTDNRLWRVTTAAGDLITTETQPLLVATDRTVPAGELEPGYRILRRDADALRAVEVRSVSPTDRRERVFNVVLGGCEAFVANGFLARSKPPATQVTDRRSE